MGRKATVSGECPSEELLAAYLERALDAEATATIRAHLDGCALCIALLAEVVDVAEPTVGHDGTQPRSDDRDELTSFDRYEVIRKLGAGSMGVVFEAVDPQLARKVAIKVVRASPGPDREREQARMLREAQAMARLSHPNLVPVLAVGTRGDALYMVLELVGGPTLRAWLAASSRPWRVVVAAYVAAGRGLAAAHVAGVVHRDFKPDNVLVAGSDNGSTTIADRIRVIDFGLARLIGTPDIESSGGEISGPVIVEQTAAGVLLGTPAYMAPEQRIDPAVDARADQFALAVSTWEGLYGERPFAGRSHAALHEAIASGAIRRPPTTSPVPPAVRRVLERGLSAAPADRFADVTAMVDALEAAAKDRKGVLAAAAAVAVTGVAATWIAIGEPHSACTPTSAPHWDDRARTGVQHAFAEVDRAIGGAAPAVLAAVDQRVAAWHDVFARTCAAAPEDAEVAATRTCLEIRRLELDAAIDVLTDGDAQVLARALPLVAALPGSEPCLRSAPQLARTDPEALVDDARSMREQLATARALGDAGRYDEAIAMTDEVVAHASEIGHAAVHAEASVRLGQLHVDASAPAKGSKLLEEAFFEARELGHDEVATEAAIALVSTLGGQLAQLDAVAPWVEHAEAALHRWGSPELTAELSMARGGVALRSGDGEAAIGHYTRSFEILQGAVDVGDPRLADAVDAIGVANMVAQHFDVAIDHHERALAMREHVLGERHPNVGKSLSNIARALIALGLVESAIHHNEWVIEIDEAALGPDHLDTAIAHNNLGAAWGLLGEPAAAAAQFRAALVGFERLGADHPEVALVLTNIGQTAVELGDHAAAAEVLVRALAIREQRFGPDDPATRASSALLGTAAALGGADALAARSIERSLIGEKPPTGYSPADLVDLRLMLGNSLLALGRRAEAEATLGVIRAALPTITPLPKGLQKRTDAFARAIERA